MSNEDKMKLILAYAYKRGHLEGQIDMARVIREKIRNSKESNPYSLLLSIENELLTLIEENNVKVAKLRNSDSFE